MKIEIRDSKKTGNIRTKMPTKNRINLAPYVDHSLSKSKAAAGIAVILIMAIIFGKFVVADRLMALHRAQEEEQQLQQVLVEGYEEIQNYKDTTKEYAHYTYDGLTTEELLQVGRGDVVTLINSYIRPNAKIGNWSVSANTLVVLVNCPTLKDVNNIATELETDPMVSYCTVVGAVSEETRTGYDSSSESVTVETGAGVQAQISVFMNLAE